MSWNQAYLLADPSYVPTQEHVDKLVRFLQERGVIGSIIRGTPELDRSVAWIPGPNVGTATLGEAWEVVLLTSREPEPYVDDSGMIGQSRLILVFKEAADAREEFVAAVSEVLGTAVVDGVSHH